MRLIVALAASAAISMPLFAQDWAKDRLEKSPRHHEWVETKNSARTVRSFIAYPEVKEKAPVIIVIHENKGLTDWVRLAADEFAEAGCIAIAPDLLSGMAPGGGGTSDYKDSDAATQGIYKLKPDQVTGDLNSVAKYAASVPAGNGKLLVAGFCWGGGQSFRYATDNPNLKAALVFYGTGPDAAAMKRIGCPVYGYYGGTDNRVNATIPK